MKKLLIGSTVFLMTSFYGLTVNAQYTAQSNISTAASSSNFKKSDYVANEILVKFKNTTTQTTLSSTVSSHGHTMSFVSNQTKLATVQFSKTETMNDILALYRANPNVLYAQQNQIYTLAVAPVDVRYPEQWSLNNALIPANDIDAESAWDIHNDCRTNNTVVAVVDTGVNYLHDDLKNSMWINPREIAGDGIDNDGNGKTDDINGWDFTEDDNSPLDTNGHGTHVSGTIAAQANNNGLGTVGVCWNASIMALRVGDSGAGGITSAKLIAAIDYAIVNGANVINLSLGGPMKLPAEQEIVTKARDNGVILAVAAGNETANNDVATTPTYPCNYKYAYSANGGEDITDPLDNIICVAAIDRNYNLSSFSNFGAENVDIAAPGEAVLSTWAVTTQEIVNQGFLTTPESAFLNWNYSPAGSPWVSSVQALPGIAGTFNMLSDPSRYGLNYVANTNTTAYRTFNFPNADALVMLAVFNIDIPTAAADRDFVSLVYSNNNAVPNIILDSFAGTGIAGAQFELPIGCSGSQCSFGVNLSSDGNALLGTGVDLLAFQIEAKTLSSTAYNTISGTSMSAPHVAGLATLIKSYNPSYTYKDVVQSIYNGGDNNLALQNITVTGKTINAFGSLTYINKPSGLAAVRN